MSFQIIALPADQFSHLASLCKTERTAQNIQKIIADSPDGFPCRVSLQDAKVGETVYLLNYAHHDEATPYRSTHAIFVREGGRQAHPAIGDIPPSIARRLLSVRAFDRSHDMINADIVEGSKLAPMIKTMFKDPEASYLHLHNARPGCYAARVNRAKQVAQ